MDKDFVVMNDQAKLSMMQARANPSAGTRFSQLGEDSILWNHFHARSDGFYVDVGCHDPFKYSNTCLLHTALNWQGINIDADPAAIERIQRVRPNDHNIHVGVGLVDEIRSFTEFQEGAVNTFDLSMATHQQVNFELKKFRRFGQDPSLIFFRKRRRHIAPLII